MNNKDNTDKAIALITSCIYDGIIKKGSIAKFTGLNVSFINAVWLNDKIQLALKTVQIEPTEMSSLLTKKQDKIISESTEKQQDAATHLKEKLALRGNTIRLKMSDVLEYECHAHWFARYIFFEWGQKVMARYIAYKVRRKYGRYLYSLYERERVLSHLLNQHPK